MACCNLSVIIVRLSLLFLPPSLTGIFFFGGGGREEGKYHLAAISIKDWLFLSYSLVSNP